MCQVVPGDLKEEIIMGDNSRLSAVSLQSTADPLRLSHPLQPALGEVEKP